MGTAECNPAAIKSTAADGTARVSCYVKLTYTYSDRESHEETPATAYRVHVHLGRRLESERLGGLHGRSLQCRLDGCAALKIINRRIRHEALVQTTHVFMVRQL